MDTLIQAKNMKPTQALRSFIHQQTSKLQRLGVPIQRVRVFLENVARKNSDPNRASVQMEVVIPRKGIVAVKSTAHDIYLGITEATQSLMRHVRKEKEKRVDVLRQRQRRIKR